MLHFSCDLCGKPLDEDRYVVKLEVYPAYDPHELTDEHLVEDHLAEVADQLQEMESNGHFDVEADETRAFRYDLCPRCRDRFLQDPLGRDRNRRLNFSGN